MSTLTLALTGFSTILPGTYIEVRFAQGQANGSSAMKKVLFIGEKTSAGTATTDTQVYQLGGEADAITYFGAGSKIHRTARRFMAECPSALCYGIAAAESAGTAGTDVITPTGAATSAGVISYTLAGETITVSVASGQSVATTVAALVSEINLQTHWPVTAADTGGAHTTVTVTAKIKGTDCNHIRHRISTTASGQTVACGGTTIGTTVPGATDALYTTALASILADDYDYIVLCLNPTAASNVRIGAVKSQIVAQALPSTGIRQRVIFGGSMSQANAVSLAAESTNGPGNQPRFSMVYLENSEWEPMEMAGWLAGVVFNYEGGSSPWHNYDSHGIKTGTSCPVPRPYSNADYPTRNEQATLIAGGVTPIAVDTLGRTYIVQLVTCSTDVRVRDVAKVAVSDRFADDLAVRWGTSGFDAVQDDPVNESPQLPPNVATPRRVKNQTIVPLYVQYAKDGWLDSAKTLDTNGDIDACATGIDPVVNTRINAKCPLHVMPLCHQFAALVTENSAG